MIFWAIWRRLYGEGTFKKYVNRTLQTIIAVVVLTLQLYCAKDCGQVVQTLLIALFIAVWVVIQYWSRAIGEIIDAGLNPYQDKKSYDRWFRVVCNWIVAGLNKILPEKYHIHKYYGFYDFIYSCFRYGIGALPLFFYSWIAVFLIPFQYFIYLGCHKFYEFYPEAYEWKFTLNEPKNLAEIIHGALFGGIICVL